MKLYQVELWYIGKPPVVTCIHAESRGSALRIACMDAEAKGWPKFANSHKIVEMK